MRLQKYILIIFFFILLPLSLFAQSQVPDDYINLPDSLVKVDSIKITGNNTTEDFVILRELTFNAGDTVSVKTLDYNRERVFSLGLFNDVNIETTKGTYGHIITINVIESWYIYPLPFIRFKDKESSKASYGVNFLYKNFRGRDETLRANLSLGYDPSITLIYNIPILLKSQKMGVGISFNYSKFSNKTKEGDRLYGGDFDYKGIQSRAYMNYRINQFNTVMGILGYEYYEAPNKSFVSISASDGRIDRFPMAGLTYMHDTRDLKQYAATGTFFDLQYYHKGFSLHNTNYNIIDVDLRKYQNIIGDLVWKGRIKSRNVFGKNVPLYDYSLLGYDEKIRGASNKRFDGKTYILASTEISIPILKEWDMRLKIPLLPESMTSARIGIQLALFADAGNTFDNFSDFSYNNFTYGWGIGINFLILPYNGFRIEYAFDKNMRGEVLIASGFSF